MFSECLVEPDARILGRPDAPCGFALGIRLNWYRSLPLSSVEELRLAIDGEDIAHDAMTLRVNDRDYPVGELGEHDDAWWFVLDAGELLIERAGGLAPGEHTAELTISTRIPYFGPAPDGSFARITDRANTTVVAR